MHAEQCMYHEWDSCTILERELKFCADKIFEPVPPDQWWLP